MSGWLKAGLIGAGVLLVLNLFGIIPYVGCCIFPLIYLSYLGIGMLAAFYLPPVREVGSAAGQGALAALIAGLIGSLAQWLIQVLRVAMLGAGGMMQQIPPELWEQMDQVGAEIPEFAFGVGGAGLFGGCCCSFSVFIAAGLGALGGLLFALFKPE